MSVLCVCVYVWQSVRMEMEYEESEQRNKTMRDTFTKISRFSIGRAMERSCCVCTPAIGEAKTNWFRTV